MFRNRPDILSEGHYVEAPPGTPHYPGWHQLWSRDWVSDDLNPTPPLGEDVNTKRVWESGSNNAAYPPPVVVGSADCIANGDRWPLPVIARDFRNVWDSRCWNRRPGESAPPPPPPLSVRQVEFQQTMAGVLATQYSDSGAAAAQLSTYLGSGYTVSHVPNSDSTTPGTIIAVSPERTVVVISGTTNPQQWVLQGMVGLTGPVDQGYYSTVPLWQQASQDIIVRINAAGADPNRPIILIGHSYGGALADVITAQYLLAFPGRDVEVLTFGAPRPGDIRLVNLMTPATQVHYANSSDPITMVPPGPTELTALAWLVPYSVLTAWQAWAKPSGVLTLKPDGSYQENAPDRVPYDVLLGFVTKILNGDPIPEFSDHSMGEYLNRLNKLDPSLSLD